MDLYHVALYVHILALIAGAIASGLLHFLMTRLERARAASDALQWFSLIGRVTKVFPAAALTFFITGGYMVAKTWTWQTPFVATGAVGVLLLLVNGITTGVRMRSLPGLLMNATDNEISARARAIIHDPVANTLPWVNTTLVLGVVFVMTTKPTLGASVVSVVVAIALGLIMANRTRYHEATASEAAFDRA